MPREHLDFATLTTSAGIAGTTVAGGIGNEAITSFGHIIGSIDLGGGTNSIDNKPFANNASASAGMFDSGSTINLGGTAAGGRLTNEGILSPGPFGTVLRTNLAGNFNQTAPGGCGAFGAAVPGARFRLTHRLIQLSLAILFSLVRSRNYSTDCFPSG